jgi:hypothetical protein
MFNHHKITIVSVALALHISVALGDDLTLANGAVLRDFRITKAEPDGLRIVHSSGIAKVMFEDLPPSAREKYNFDPDKAEAFRGDVRAMQKQAAEDRKRKSALIQSKEEEALMKAKMTPRLTKIQSVKDCWLRTLPYPRGLDANFTKKQRFCAYMTNLIRSGSLDLEAEQTMIQWNISEYQRVEQNDNANALASELARVREAIQKRDELKQQAEIAAMQAELQSAQIRSLDRLADALNNVAFSFNSGSNISVWNIR